MNAAAKHCEADGDCYAYVFPAATSDVVTFRVADTVTRTDRQTRPEIGNTIDAATSSTQLVAAAPSGVSVFDISDPSHPSFDSLVPGHAGVQPEYVGVNQHFVLSVERHGSPNTWHLWIHDLTTSKPDCDVVLHDYPGHSVIFHDFAVDDTWVYMSLIDMRTPYGLRRFRISDLLAECAGS